MLETDKRENASARRTKCLGNFQQWVLSTFQQNHLFNLFLLKPIVLILVCSFTTSSLDMLIDYSCCATQAQLEEKARVTASNGMGKNGTAKASQRADLVARTYMVQQKCILNAEKLLGHVPGFKCNDR